LKPKDHCLNRSVKTDDQSPRKAWGFTLLDFRFLAIGIIGLACILVWAAGLLIMGYDEWIASPAIGVTGRVGFLLTVLWIAVPTIQPLFKYRSSLLWGFIIVVVIFLVFRPKMLSIFVAAIVIASSVNWVLKIFAQAARPD